MIVTVETSDVVLSVCAYNSSTEYSLQELRHGKSHSKMIFTLFNQALQSLNAGLNDAEALVFSGGPGSFTGLRIGLAAIKGIAAGAGLPIAVVPTVEASVYQLSLTVPENVPVCILQKINSTEFFLTEFTLSKNIVKLEKRLEIISEAGFISLPEQGIVFCNVRHAALPQARIFTGPSALSVAEYYQQHKDEIELLHDYALLEPDYLREFVIKEKVTQQ